MVAALHEPLRQNSLQAYCVRIRSVRTIAIVEHAVLIVLLFLGPIMGLAVWAYDAVTDSHGLRRARLPEATAPPLESASTSIQRPAA